MNKRIDQINLGYETEIENKTTVVEQPNKH